MSDAKPDMFVMRMSKLARVIRATCSRRYVHKRFLMVLSERAKYKS